ncbi:DUF4184 family protein [Candidatus Bathyarchaeota archaeon]|nr:MAG: DUF4184 family protein [Candidatus Bathyarchaeota archaeon]
MPITPLHYFAAYLIYRISRRYRLKLNFPGLIVGSLIPDLEIPFFYFFTNSLTYDRLILHSILGGIFLGTLISVLLTVYVYPSIIQKIFRLKATKENFKFSLTLVFSCLIGVLSHIFLDSLHHPYNPLFYPFTTQTINGLVLFHNPSKATLTIHLVLLVTAVFIIGYELRKGLDIFWKNMFLD